jgi:sulfate-transporting ATPase
MLDLLRFTILGAAAGSVLALLALGVTVINRASRVVNFSQAAIGVTAAYAYHDYLARVPQPVALLLSLLTGVALGGLIEVVIMRPLRQASTLTRAIATIGVLLVLQSVLNIRYGYNPVIVPAWLPTSSVAIGGMRLGADRLLTAAIAIVLTAAVYLFFKRTRLGLASTALSVSPRSLAALGTSSPGVVGLVNWLIAGALAAAAGLLLAPVTSLSPTLATTLVVPVLSVALLGRMESYLLTFAGGLAIGAMQGILSVKVHLPGAQDAVPFLVIALMLTLRGNTMPARGEVAERLPRISDGRIPWAIIGFFTLVTVVLVSWVLPTPWVTAVTVCVVTATVLISLVVVTGYAGQLNLASFALAGVAALVSALLVFHLHWGFIPAAIVGVLATIPVGLLVGLPAIRTRGTALGVITLGLAVAFQSMILNNQSIANGLAGLAVGNPTLFGFNISAIFFPRRYALFAIAALVIVGIMVLNLRRSSAGRRMVAVRGNEAAASSIGVSVARTKLYAFVVSSMIAGVGGVLIAFMNFNIVLGNPGGRFDPAYSINAVAEITVGGIGWVGGAVAGSAMEPGSVANQILQFLTQGAWLNLIGGVLMLLTIITAPAGIAAIQSAQFRALARRLPGSARRAARRQAAAAAVLGASAASAEHVTQVEPATLRIEGLVTAFGGNPVLKSVDLEVSAGKVLGVIGPNGAGKTTLLESITGFNRPQSGRVLLNGEDITRCPATERARLGVVRSFQSLELFEDLSVYDNLLVASDRPAWWRSLVAGLVPGRSTLSGAATAAVLQFGLDERLYDDPADLSYGERRLLAIARALATRPRVLLLDEPAAGLGATERRELSTIIRRIADEWGIAVFLIEHDVELVMGVSDEVVALDFGTVIARGTPQEVRNSPEVIAAYLGADHPVATIEEAIAAADTTPVKGAHS